MTFNQISPSPGGVIIGFSVNNGALNPAIAPMVVGDPGNYNTDENIAFSGIIILNAGDTVRLALNGTGDGENYSVSYTGFSGYILD